MADVHTASVPGSLALIRRLLSENAREHVPRYAAALGCMVVMAATSAASAWIMKDVVNEIFIGRDASMTWMIAGAVMLIFVVRGAATFGQAVLLGHAGNAIIASIQRRLYERVLGQGVDFYQAIPLGDLATRMSHNAQAARGVIETLITGLGRDLLTLVGLAAVMVVQDPMMSLGALVILPPAVLGISHLITRVKRLARAEFDAVARIVTAMQETVLGVGVVKAFGLEGRMRARMEAAIADVRRRSDRIVRANALTSPLIETLGGLAIAGIILYGGYKVIRLGHDPGTFFSFIAAFLLAYDPARRLARFQVQLAAGLVGVRLLFELLDRKPTLLETPDAPPLRVSAGEIRFEDVAFAYGEARALNGLSFTAAPGKVTALVGPSGAGKSTVFALLERFYDPQAGRIVIDGQDLRGVALASLRSGMALVGQDTFLFQGTVRDNIADGRIGAGEAEIVAAAAAANADAFIRALPDGYDSLVGESGARLSGGQRQRIAIARAMLRDAPILLLDEATSALDASSEARVQEALARLMRGRTTIVIAHRLSTVRDADMIHVLEGGRVVQSGRHDELVARPGLYATLAALQFRDAG